MALRVALVMVAIGGALAVHFALDVSLGLAFFVFFVGWPILGTLVTIDDDLPGGWSNPDGSVRPPWRRAPFWERIGGGVAISAAAFALEAVWQAPSSIKPWSAATVAALVSAALLKRTSSLRAARRPADGPTR
jgi:hypothetical protein